MRHACYVIKKYALFCASLVKKMCEERSLCLTECRRNFKSIIYHSSHCLAELSFVRNISYRFIYCFLPVSYIASLPTLIGYAFRGGKFRVVSLLCLIIIIFYRLHFQTLTFFYPVLDLAGKGYSFEEPAKRLYPDHTRLCPAKQRYVNSKDAFKGRFSKHAFILPIAFETISCEKSNETSQSPNGSRCLGIMDCQETKSSKYFIVRDLASRKNGGCMVQRIVKLNSVPVECSCYWPLLLGSSPRLFFNRRRS